MIKIEKGKKTTERTYIIQVNDKESSWLSDIEIKHSANQKFDLLDAHIIGSNDQVVRKLKKKEVITKNDISYGTFYQDHYIKGFDLHWNEYPYKIKYSFSITEDEFFYITKWYPAVFSNVETIKSSLRIEIPEDYKISLDHSVDFQFDTFSIDNRKVFRWEMGKFSISKQEVFSPPVQELLPYVSVVPIEFKYGVTGNAETWESYGSWYNELNKDADLLPISDQVRVNDLIKGAKDKKEKVRRLYHYLQDHTNYVNIATDIGGLKPYPASYVSQNKYGDCKALTIYMKALLKHAGIESYYTIINAGANAGRINVAMPAQQFNHVILTVPVENDTLWLENTSSTSPFNYLGTSTQNRMALLVDKSNSRLIRTPKLVLEDVLEKRKYIFSLTEDGTGQVNIEKILKGEAFERYRYYQMKLSAKDQKEKFLKDINVKNFELKDWTLQQSHRDENEVKLTLSSTCFNQFRDVGKLKVIQPVKLKIPELEKAASRIHSLRINYPVNLVDLIIYKMPFLHKYDIQLPENTIIDSEHGRYEVNYKRLDDKIVINQQFQLFAADYAREAYADFSLFIESIINSQNQSAIILTTR